jgi:hypothetical protein
MRCSSLYPPRWPTGVLWYGYVSTAAPPAEAPAATGIHEACRRVTGASAARYVRDCGHRSASAAVMQVRPPSVSSGTAGSSPFGCSPFGRLGWL